MFSTKLRFPELSVQTFHRSPAMHFSFHGMPHRVASERPTSAEVYSAALTSIANFGSPDDRRVAGHVTVRLALTNGTRRARSIQGARTCRRLATTKAQASPSAKTFASSDASNGSPDELFNNAVDMAAKPDHVPVRVCRTVLSGKIGKAYTLVWCPGVRRRQRHQPRSSLTRGDRTSAKPCCAAKLLHFVERVLGMRQSPSA
jgi:hypothetical protein